MSVKTSMKSQTLLVPAKSMKRRSHANNSTGGGAAAESKWAALLESLPPGWVYTWGWSIGALTLYVVLGQLVTWVVPFNLEGQIRLHSMIPPFAYYLSAMAFFTAFTLNAVSLVFEDTAPKRQLALLSCLVKGLSCHCDLVLGSGQVIVLVDTFAGGVLMPQHFVQWMVTCPLMLVAIARTSDFTVEQTLKTVGANMSLVAFGFSATLMPMPYAMAPFCMAFTLFLFVLKQMHVMMLGSIGKDEASASARKSWQGIYWCSFANWVLFPTCWLLARFGTALWPGADIVAEAVVMFANFMAKVVLSSSVVYGNYLTVAQRRLQAQQRAENEERVALVAQLTNAITQKDEFMSLMSHELRTPLNGIIQLSDSLARGGCGDLGEKGRHFAGTIKNSSNHLLNIINDILDAAALKEGRLAIKHERVDLNQAVQHVIDIVTPLARKGVVLEKNVDPRIPTIVADAGRVIQILYNLAGNSLKFTHTGKVSISVRPGSQPHYIVISVADTGVGIPKDKLGSIFEAFEQVDMSVSRKYGGTGLGLNIVKSLVDAHKGSISVSSEVGKGTEFLVRLPVLQENIRKSLERTIRSSLEHHGMNFDRISAALNNGRNPDTAAGAPTGRRSVSSRESSFSLNPGDGSARSSSSWARGVTRTGSVASGAMMAVLSPSHQPPQVHGSSQPPLDPLPEGGVPGRDQPKEMSADQDMLVKRAMKRSRELEYEHTVGDLVRRTELRRSLVDEESDSIPAARAPSKTSGAAQNGKDSSSDGHSGSDSHSKPAGRSSTAYRSDLYKLTNGNASGRDNRSSSSDDESDGPSLPPVQTKPKPCAHFASRAASPVPSGSERSQQPARPRSAPPISRRGSGTDEDTCPLTPLKASGKSGAGMPAPSPALQNGNWGKAGLSPRMSLDRGSKQGSPAMGVSSMKPSYSNINGTVQILSVDDEEVNQMVLQEILESVGYQFQYAMNGPEALDFLSHSETLPDLILLDCMMPEMSGHQFVSILRETVPTSMLPVIMVSAKADEKNIVEGLKSGCNDFVRKPYNRQELLARIESLLRVKADSTWMTTILRSSESVAGDGDSPHEDEDDQEGQWSLGGAGRGGKGGGKSEALKLLQSILPESIIKRMRSGQQFVADSHPHVCVLFTDIVGFTTLSSQVPTAEVFMMLSNMFTAFDRLVDRFDVYKVETIGDAYMAVAGHEETPDKSAKGTPVHRMLQMARAMLEVVRNFIAPNGQKLRIRVGVHCGPAYAGVIGLKCPRYCFLGDTVNTAARMESTGFPMAVHVSSAVVAASEDPESFCEVGARDVKGKGMMTTYLLKAGEWEEAVTTLQALTAGLLTHDPTHGYSETVTPPATATPAAAPAAPATALPAAVPAPPTPTAAPAPAAATPAAASTQALQPALLQPGTPVQYVTTYAGPPVVISAPGVSDAALRHELAEQQKRVLQLEGLLQHAQAAAVTAQQRERVLKSRLAVAGGSRPASPAVAVANGSLESSLQALLGRQQDEGGASCSHYGTECSVPGVSVLQLLAGLGMADVYGPMFEAEAVTLQDLLQMDAAALRIIGVLPLGHCLQIREAVINLARSCLSRCDMGYHHHDDDQLAGDDDDEALNRFLFGDGQAASTATSNDNPLFEEGASTSTAAATTSVPDLL